MNEHVPEQETPLQNLLRRFRLLGASQDEVLAIRENWWVDTDDWGDDDRARVLRSSDSALRAMIAAVRNEWADVQPVELDREPLRPLEVD